MLIFHRTISQVHTSVLADRAMYCLQSEYESSKPDPEVLFFVLFTTQHNTLTHHDLN